MKTALSTNFYGGKKGMKKRIFSIMDTGKKRAGVAVICAAMLLTIGTGAALAVNAQAAEQALDNNFPISAQEQASLEQQRKNEMAQSLAEYTAYGMTYDMEHDLFWYNEKVVRYFYDAHAGRAFTPNYSLFDFEDYDKAVDLTAIYIDGKLSSLSPASNDAFAQRTESILQAQKKQEQMQSSNVDTAGSYDPNYKDTTFDYLKEYGVSYDDISKSWVFNGQSIGFLIDEGYQTYVNIPVDDTDSDFAEKVEEANGVFLKVTRKTDGSINEIIELTPNDAVKALNDIFN
jgi:hypothetical protein